MSITREAIRRVLGPVDDQLLAQIVAMDVSESELAEAQAWHSADERMINEGRHLPSGRVAELIALLEDEEAQDEP